MTIVATLLKSLCKEANELKEKDSLYYYGGISDYGDRETNEDFLTFQELSSNIMLAVVADGAGSRQCGFALQPAVIAATDLIAAVQRIYNANPEILSQYSAEILTEAMQAANRTIGVFKVANETLYSGFGVCVSACLLLNGKAVIAHCGNTRVYLIRYISGESKILQLTHDHTSAATMVSEGTLSEEEYYSHPGRYTYTSGLGFAVNPEIQTFSITTKKGDLLALTTDGIHYAIRPKYISEIILQARNWKEAAQSLINGAKSQEMDDNMTAAVIQIK